MVSVIITGHSTVPSALMSAAEMILGEQSSVTILNLLPDTNIDTFGGKVEATVSKIDTGDGVLILCDLLGGSPSNKSSVLIQKGVQVVTGVNLPMLLTVLLNRESKTSDELAQLAREAGVAGVVHVNEEFSIN